MADLSDFLPRLIGPELADELLSEGRRFFWPEGDPFIPLEFADAAYRYGHSQIRNSCRLNDHAEPLPLFPDLMGFQPVPAAWVVDWSYLLDLPGRAGPQPAKRIDGTLPRPLIELPLAITGEVELEAFHSLAARDLQRGQATALPSGEAVARRMNLTPLDPGQTGLTAVGWDSETPLWFYVLREADVLGDGERLGPVGGRIVGEVLLGIVDLAPESYRVLRPDWEPTLPRSGERFQIGDLLAFAISR